MCIVKTSYAYALKITGVSCACGFNKVADFSSMFETWRHPFLKKPHKSYEVIFFYPLQTHCLFCFYFRKVAILTAFKFQDDSWVHVEFMFWFTFFCCNKLTWKCPNVSLKISCAFTTTNAKTSSLTAVSRLADVWLSHHPQPLLLPA